MPMTDIASQRPTVQTSRVLLCCSQPAPLIEKLAAVDDSTLEIEVAPDQPTALKRLAERTFEVCLVDVTWDDAALSELCAALQQRSAATQVVRLADTNDTSIRGPWNLD